MKKLLFLLIFPISLFSQDILMTGLVVDDDSNQPLPGVNVIIKNTVKGTTTNFDGLFELKTVIGDTIVFSYIGMKDKEIIALSVPVSVRLESKSNELDEVVVSVGYFDVSKKDDVFKINDKDLKRLTNLITTVCDTLLKLLNQSVTRFKI